MEWIDVAGLAKNAHRGEGLGNQFLATLRECDTLCHVVRTFEDTTTTHVSGEVNPCNDIDDIHLELLLADLSHVQRRLERIGGSKRRNNEDEDLEFLALEKVVEGLQEGKPARTVGLSSEERFSIKRIWEETSATGTVLKSRQKQQRPPAASPTDWNAAGDGVAVQVVQKGFCRRFATIKDNDSKKTVTSPFHKNLKIPAVLQGECIQQRRRRSKSKKNAKGGTILFYIHHYSWK